MSQPEFRELLLKSYINVIVTNNPSLIASAGTRPKMYDTCDHKQIYVTWKSTIFKPHSYKRWVWNYDRGEMERFQYVLFEAPWHSCAK